MTLSIIILNYKSKALVRECIKGIRKYDLGFEYEIIVVDNGSHDGITAMIETKFQDVRLVKLLKNTGYGAGNNAGIKQARGKYVMILNPDVTVFRSSIKPLVDFLEANPAAGIAAPMILNPDKTHQPSAHRFPSIMMPFYRRTFLGKTRKGREYLKHYTVQDISNDTPSKVDWIFGPAFVMRKDVADQMHSFDERFFLFMEDTDLCHRVELAGYEVWYVPKARVVHYPDRASRHDLGLLSLTKKTTWYHIASWIKYFWKWRSISK